MKAYVVDTDYSEAGVMVFADTRNEAKNMASGSMWLDGCEWIELRARREPRADKYAEKFGKGAIECSRPDQCRMLRDLGWYEVDGGGACDHCGYSEWTSVPESRLTATENGDGICQECLNQIKQNENQNHNLNGVARGNDHSLSRI